MIVDLFLRLVNMILSGILSLVSQYPDVKVSDDFISSFASAKNYAMIFADILPLTAIFATLGVVLVVRNYAVIWAGINWLIRRLPTQS